ncbi:MULTISPECIES: lysophospholipid acyltransferase family protein [Bacillus]|uniref:lysophospholipid acyltransferase family protein n=1 Tax=Bacillus TaxID=1386 RepID=UPI0012FEE1BD|nr:MULTISPECIES: lysophospholipid acyltransferase family protein [Bacillus]
MIPAKKSKMFEMIFYPFNRRLLSLHFRGIYVKKTYKEMLLEPPVIFICNHSTWWDGLVIYHLNKRFANHDSYAMMQESGMKEHPFFRKIGGFSINRSNPKDIILSLKYARNLLKSGKSIWIFPQGDEKHLEIRPLQFQAGTMHIVKEIPTTPIIPVAIYYTFGHVRKPEIYINIGEPLLYEQLDGKNPNAKTTNLELLFTKLLDELKRDVMNETHELYESIL